MSSTAPTLYALLIGVNVYRNPKISDLRGCVADVQAVRGYLEAATATAGSRLDAVSLLDEAATKSAITSAIVDHLGKAQAGDTALLYFSGHGAEEEAAPVFHRFNGEKHTTLVCHDSRTDGVCDLADKELRYWIAKVARPGVHLVLVTDSCHSGGVTRSDLTPRLTTVSPMRAWAQYDFAAVVTEEDVARASALSEVLPEGNHVHLSSCEANELAYEVDGQGVFTRFLLETLGRNTGAVTYRDLNRQARLRLRGRYPQQPTLYATDEAWLGQLFLGGTAEQDGLEGWLHYDVVGRCWKLDMGAIHGLSVKAAGMEDSTKVVVLGADGVSLGEVTLLTCGAASAIVGVEGLVLDRDVLYRVRVTGVLRSSLRVAVVGEAAATCRAGIEPLLGKSNIVLTNEVQGADVALRAGNGQVVLTWPDDEKPLVQALALDGAFTWETLAKRYLVDVAGWMYLRQLQPPVAMLTPDPCVAIEVARSGEQLSPKGGVISVRDGDKLHISVRNVHRRTRLYVALYYLDQRFGVHSLLATGASVAPGEVHRVLEGKAIAFEVEPYIKALGFDYEFFELKCVYSTAPMSLYGEGQASLPAPDLPLKDASQQQRPLERRQQPSVPAWGEVLVRVEGRLKKK